MQKKDGFRAEAEAYAQKIHDDAPLSDHHKNSIADALEAAADTAMATAHYTMSRIGGTDFLFTRDKEAYNALMTHKPAFYNYIKTEIIPCIFRLFHTYYESGQNVQELNAAIKEAFHYYNTNPAEMPRMLRKRIKLCLFDGLKEGFQILGLDRIDREKESEKTICINEWALVREETFAEVLKDADITGIDWENFTFSNKHTHSKEDIISACQEGVRAYQNALRPRRVDTSGFPLSYHLALKEGEGLGSKHIDPHLGGSMYLSTLIAFKRYYVDGDITHITKIYKDFSKMRHNKAETAALCSMLDVTLDYLGIDSKPYSKTLLGKTR